MNSQLYDKKYPIPINIIKQLKTKLMIADSINGDGIKRAKFLVNNGYATYQMMKRIKNFFDHFDATKDTKQEFELAGGEPMRMYIEHTLNNDRANAGRSTELKKPGMPDMKAGIHPQNVLRTEGEDENPNGGYLTYNNLKEFANKKIVEATETISDNNDAKELKKNVLAVIINPEKRILLLKRSTFPDQWQPSKWSLVGGGVEEGEDPLEGCRREVKEETGLIVDPLMEKAVLQRNPDSVEHIYIAKYDGDPFNIKLDKENQGYSWFGINEIKFLDCVPNLMDYIGIALKDYD